MESLTLQSRSAEETRTLGEALGRVLQDGDFVGLAGELGAGKTELARGIARGAGVPDDEVASPTFAIVHAYAGRLPVAHADLYRIASADELYGTGYHELLEAPGAMLVEWVDRVPGAAPPDAVRVALTETVDGHRTLSATATGPRSRHLLDRWHDELLGHEG